MSEPVVSVIVPTYGRPEFLVQALASVAAQTVASFECIVVDDASPGGATLPVDDVRFRLIRHEENRGPGGVRNTGIRAARAPVLVFLDDDDLMTPIRLEVAIDVVQRAPIGLCGQGLVGGTATSAPTLEGDVSSRILDKSLPNLGVIAVRHEACIEFDERYRACEDLDWRLRMAQRHRVASDPRVGWLWRRHDGPRVSHGAQPRIDGSLQLLEDHAEYFRQHHRAAAFRWRRIAHLAAQTEQPSLRRRAAIRSARFDLRPSNVARAGKLFFGVGWSTDRRDPTEVALG